MIEFDLAEVEAELRALFPSLPIPAPVSMIGSGFNSLVVEAGGTIVFRIGKNSVAQAGYARETSCLPIIAPHIPFLIPNPKCYSKSSAYFPFGVIGYDKVPGKLLQPNVLNDKNLSLLASDTAKFLIALHRISRDVLPSGNSSDPASTWEEQYRNVLPVLKAELSSAEFRLVKQWWADFLADQEMQKYHPVLQHGDLWYENMLVDPAMERLIGVIDWERISIGDPAQDFATLFHTGEMFVRLVMQAYQSLGGELDENFEYRMQRLWEAREFDGLDYAIQFEDPVELSDSVQKLRHGPILKRTFRKTKEK